MAAGILAQKADYEPLIKYAEEATKNNGKLNNNVQSNEPLILAADGLSNGLNSSDESIRKQCASALTKVFKAACENDIRNPIADQLMQSFMVTLPKKGNSAYAMMLDVFKDKTANIGARSVAAFIMSNTNPILSFSTCEDFVISPDKFADKASDKLYLLDTITNSIGTTTKEYPDLNNSKIKEGLNKINLDELFVQAKIKGINEEKLKELSSIATRVKERISELN